MQRLESGLAHQAYPLSGGQGDRIRRIATDIVSEYHTAHGARAISIRDRDMPGHIAFCTL